MVMMMTMTRKWKTKKEVFMDISLLASWQTIGNNGA